MALHVTYGKRVSAHPASSEAPPALPQLSGRRLAVLRMDPVGAEIARRNIVAGQRGATEMQLDRDEKDRFMKEPWPRGKTSRGKPMSG